MSSEINSELLALLLKHEGFSQFPYRDTVGKLTIGIGRNLEDNGVGIHEAELMLYNDASEIRKQIISRWPAYENLTDSRKHALIDMGMMGVGKLMTFRRMFAALDRGDWQAAHDECLDSKWAKQVGKTRANDCATRLRDG